jgi:fluoroacetyl-CoA thioesterase
VVTALSGHRATLRAGSGGGLRSVAAAVVPLASVSLEPGLSAEIDVVVKDGDTAVALGSGDVEVLGTPRVVALCEEASIEAIAGQLPPGQTSVGMRVQLDHLQPTAVGHRVTVEAWLEKVEGRRLIFGVSVNDARGLVAAGKVTRVVVDRDRFMDKAK